MALGATLALVGGVGAANATPGDPHKSYVCKYVSTPGERERLQTGNNPIFVDNSSLLGGGKDGTVEVGQQFKDGQILSVVIVANTDKLTPEPTIDDCPASPPPTTSTSTTSSSTTSTSSTTTDTTTTATFHPPTKTTTTTTSPSTRTMTTTPTGTATATTYPLQPVKAGVSANATPSEAVVTPLRAALALLALFGLWLAMTGRLPRRPRLTRVDGPEGQG